jgi:nuclear pore complex protein Nup214
MCKYNHLNCTLNDLISYLSAVSARQAYMKGILSQSSDTQYWDIWNRQKLSPEFEAKRQNILKANQVLRSDSSLFEILMN